MGSHRTWATNQGTGKSWTLTPYTFEADVRLGLHLGPLTMGEGSIFLYVPSIGTPTPYLNYLVRPQREGMSLGLVGLDAQSGVVTKRGSPSLR